jgi:hypothetical protein
MDPNDVKSPRDKWQLIRVLHNGVKTGTGWSLACGLWEGKPCLAKRWDGDGPDSKGHPISTGHAVWFIEPDEFYEMILASAYVSDADREFVRNFLGLHAKAA